MFKTNHYFDNKVVSIAFQTAKLPATVGVMAPGDYEFSTSQKETMTVVSGGMKVLLPDTTDWQQFTAGETFIIAANQSFKVSLKEETAYLCLYGEE